MARVTENEVKTIASDDIPADAELSVFIAQAALITGEDLAGKGLSEERLKAIEMNLAAHFAILKFKYVVASKVGAVGENMANTVGQGFKATVYGQQALTLDGSGTLKNLDDQNKQGSWIMAL